MQFSLRNLKPMQIAIVSKITVKNELGKRIRDLGIVKGSKISVVGKAPLNDPVAIKVNNNFITLRNNESDYIFIDNIKDL